MKKIDHNYWIGKYKGKDADFCNPDLRVAMRELYGHKGFDFGTLGDTFYDDDRKNHYRPDGYSSYVSLTENYITSMPFRHEAVKNNVELAERCYFLAGTIAGELFFPAHRFDGNTINQARGGYGMKDMVHQLLESIRRYYEREHVSYPLKEALERYGYFFDSFVSFDEYIEYNFLQDHRLLPDRFPRDESELVEFWTRSIDFMEARSRRIEEYATRNNLLNSEL